MSEFYGSHVLLWGDAPVSYEVYVGLYLNRDRELLRRATPVAMGAGLMFAEKVPREFVEANAETKDQTELILALQEANKPKPVEVPATNFEIKKKKGRDE